MVDFSKRITQLDGLRAIAILLVFLHHIVTKPIELFLYSIDWNITGQFLNYLTSSGVQLFYVLSGVLLLRPYLHKTRTFDTFKYFKRRLERLYPTYFVVLLTTALIFYLASTFPNWYSKEQMLDFSLLNFITQLPIFHINSPYYNPVLWSLEIEFLFYLTLPIVVFIFLKFNFGKIVYSILFAAFVLISIYIQFNTKIYNSLFPLNIIYTFLYYSPCFFLGIVIAKFNFTQKQGFIFLCIGIIYIALSLRLLPKNTAPSFGVLYFALIILSFKSSFLIKILNKNTLTWFGERSYSFFLIHFPMIILSNYIISFVEETKNLEYFILTRIFSIFLSLIATILLFHFVEKRNAGKLLTSHQFFPFSKK